MAKFKKGDKIIFTFIAMEYPELIPSGRCLDTGLIVVGVGEIVCGPDPVSYYGVKVVEPPDWKSGNELGGILHGADRGRGWFFHEGAMRLEKSAGKNLNNPQDRTCSECDSKMVQGALSDWYCTNNDCPTNRKS